MLGELATTNAARVTEYRSRKTRYDQRTFRRDESEYAISEGWEFVRENQNSDRYQKLKLHDEQLENEFWCLLYNFGYPNLNIGRNFQIEVTSNKRVTVSKQVDVFGYDHETIIVAECKSCEKRTKRQLQKDIGDFVANQKPIANTLRRFLGSDFKQKIIWFFVTKNVEWSEPDLARAEEANIRVITEKDLFYYKEIAKRIGKAARYQFHAEFLANTKVHALERKVFAMRTKLGAHKAYTFFASAETILPIAFVNHRDLRDGSILTIPYLVDATLQSGLLGRILTASGSTTYVQGPLLWEDPREAITALSELLTEYFDLFRAANSQRWNAAKAGKFATNVGVAALIRLLGDVIAFMSAKDHEDINKLRRVSAHPYNRGYDDAEVDEIHLIYQTIIKRQLIAV